MDLTFRELIYNCLSPFWFRAKSETEGAVGWVHWASRVIYSGAIQIDALCDLTRLAVRARFPEWCIPDPNQPGGQRMVREGLAAMGTERGIRRGHWESDLTYAHRLRQWIATHKRSGSPFALLQQIRAFFYDEIDYPKVAIVGNGGTWFAIDPDGTERQSETVPINWDWDGDETKVTRYWLIVWPKWSIWSADEDAVHWGTESNWGDGHRWYGVPFAEDLRIIVYDWSPPHARCDTILLVDHEHASDLSETMASGLVDGTWGKWYKIVDDVAVPSRVNYCAFVDGPRVADYGGE